MMPHKLGVYLAPGHHRPPDLDYIRRLQPKAIRVLDPDVNDLIQAHEAAPHALLLPRDWALSEQKQDMLRDPLGTGKRHAHEWRAKIDGWRAEAKRRGQALPANDRQWAVVGINEPNELGDRPEIYQAIAGYTSAFLSECTALGLRACALNLGVGHPAPLVDGKPDWSPYLGLEAIINAGGHFLTLHEYWWRTGPQDGWGWHAGRFLFCPMNVPILIGECGIDLGVDTARWANEGGERGWRGNVEPEDYARQLAYYHDRLDERVFCILPFLTDYRSNQWESFDTAEAHAPILRWLEERMDPARETATVHVPKVEAGPKAAKPAPAAVPSVDWCITAMARVLAVDPKLARAFLRVESGNRGFAPDGRPIIRFENHVFWQEWGKRTPDAFNRHFEFDRNGQPWMGHRWRPDDGEWRTCHTSQAEEWAAFEFARTLDAEAACRSISMGRGQIMGFNHARLGYPSASAMLADFSDKTFGELNQIIGFFAFVAHTPGLEDAMRAGDYEGMARAYNGPGQVATYAKMIRAAHLEQ